VGVGRFLMTPTPPKIPSDSDSAALVLVGRAEGKRPLGRPTRRREDNIKIDQEVGGGNGLY
jgi:hypothetical protein